MPSCMRLSLHLHLLSNSVLPTRRRRDRRCNFCSSCWRTGRLRCWMPSMLGPICGFRLRTSSSPDLADLYFRHVDLTSACPQLCASLPNPQIPSTIGPPLRVVGHLLPTPLGGLWPTVGCDGCQVCLSGAPRKNLSTSAYGHILTFTFVTHH